MLLTNTMPTHAEQNRRVLFSLNRANIAAFCLDLYDRAAGRLPAPHTAELPVLSMAIGGWWCCVLPRLLAPNQKGAGLRASVVACGARKKKRHKKFTVAASDFTAERYLQLIALFPPPPFNPMALNFCHRKGTWLRTRMFRLGARPCQAAVAQDL
jgi:hypothetical protein